MWPFSKSKYKVVEYENIGYTVNSNSTANFNTFKSVELYLIKKN